MNLGRVFFFFFSSMMMVTQAGGQTGKGWRLAICTELKIMLKFDGFA